MRNTYGNTSLSPLPGSIDQAGVTPGSQSLAWGLTLIAAPQLCCVITSNVEAKRNMDQAGDLCDSLPDLVSGMSEIKRYA